MSAATAPRPTQRERGAAAAQLAEAKARIHEVLDQLAAERSQTAALKVGWVAGLVVAGAVWRFGMPAHGWSCGHYTGFWSSACEHPLLGSACEHPLPIPCTFYTHPLPISCTCHTLQAQAAEAAQQLAEANSRYRSALEQLQAERARADALQVRICGETRGARSQAVSGSAPLQADSSVEAAGCIKACSLLLPGFTPELPNALAF